MTIRYASFLTILAFVLPPLPGAGAETQAVTSVIRALDAYDKGFAFDVMRAKDGVVLDNLILLENDGPGVGHSEKGTFIEEIHAGVLAKKIFQLEDTAAEEAHAVIYLAPQNSPAQAPYFLVVNGHRIQGNPLPRHDGRWHWIALPLEYLKPGLNEIAVGCDAPQGQGYELLVAREDEYEKGGGKYTYQGNTALISANLIEVWPDVRQEGIQPIPVGEYSAKSQDGGKTWVKRKLGTTNDVVGEYAIRLHFTKRKPLGFLWSPPIDLWDGLDNFGHLKPQCDVSGLTFQGQGDTPPGTTIAWSVRFADTPDMLSAAWGDFQSVGAGASVSAPVDNGGRRYMQWEARLESVNPLATPLVYSAQIDCALTYDPPEPNTFYVKDYVNPELRYTSYRFAYEKSDTPQLAELRNRLRLDEVVSGANGDFDRINRLRHYVSQLWYHGSPLPGYPEWNALDILDRRDKVGKGGMCIQFSLVFIQSLQALGYQARHMNIFNHETVEVYVDELGKWVHVDPESVFDSYEFNTDTGEPVNTLDQHKYFLAQYGLSAAHPIDWMNPNPWNNHSASGLPETPQPLEISTYTPWLNHPDPAKRPPQHRLAGFIRMIPRNNFLSQPTPRPLSQGSTYWPWNGYVNWYDEATPRHLQYALHSDREADFYPTLNQVAFSAVHGDQEGEILIGMVGITPNFETYEVNVDDTGWRASGERFVWRLNRSAVNTLEMRTRNALGVTGKPSRLQIVYHYREPYRPKPAQEAAVRE